jgi:hypothetical protein
MPHGLSSCPPSFKIEKKIYHLVLSKGGAMKALTLIITSMIFLLFLHPPVKGDLIYIWTDEQGVKHFSNEAPPEGSQNVEKIETDTQNSAPPEDAAGRRETYNQMVEKAKTEANHLDQERKEKEAAADEQKKQEAEKQRQEQIQAQRQKIQAKIDALNQRGLGPNYSKGMRDYQINELKKELEKLDKPSSMQSNKE